MAKGGTFVYLRGASRPTGNSSGHKRGRIRDFSASSRRRFIHRLESVDWDEALSGGRLQWFSTLTVHQDEGVNHAKAAFEALTRRLDRAMPSTLLAWKLEPQKRGAPHYHCVLIVDPQEVASVVGGCRPRCQDEVGECPMELLRLRFEALLLEWWRDVTGQPTITRVTVEDPKSAGGIRRYMTKYMSKAHPVPEHWQGHRYWGFRGDWPQTTIVCQLHGNARWELRRMVRSWTKSKRRAARAARGRPGAGRSPWRDPYGAMRVCVPTDLLREMLRGVRGRFLGVRDGPPACLA